MDQPRVINGVDITSHVVSAEITVERPEPEPLPFSITPDFSIGGELSTTLTPDEWAAITEHVVVSHKPGRL